MRGFRRNTRADELCGARKKRITVALVGNPNVGKSTLFNALTGLRQHTGNWAGKTVESAEGVCRLGDTELRLVDLPGTYSLHARSPEEKVARDAVFEGEYDIAVVVIDATCPSRGLNLALQVMSGARRVLLCFNLMDEAEKRGIHIDLTRVEKILGVPAVGTVAKRKKTLKALVERICETVGQAPAEHKELLLDSGGDADGLPRLADELTEQIMTVRDGGGNSFGGRLDRLLTGRYTAYPIMALLLLFIIYLTVSFANYPSALLSSLFGFIGEKFHGFLVWLSAPEWLIGALYDGIYTILSEVVSVMLPPMAIFFPLFTLLEDAGFLPRFAYNLDAPFRCVGACGKQALTMCMGLGCNAAGVVGCRIIDSRRERNLAIVTNALIPCNGKFPTYLLIVGMFLGVGGFLGSFLSALSLLGVILLGVGATFLCTFLLSRTVWRGRQSFFTIEMPPFRRPDTARVLVRSFIDRTLSVLGRAVIVAVPAGLIIWLCSAVEIGGVSILSYITDFLDPLGRLLGFDGVVLTAFILGVPANEIVIPIAVIGYTGVGAGEAMALGDIGSVLAGAGWTPLTAISVMLFSLFHWPCSTTMITVYKETRSIGITALSVLLPTLLGAGLCILLNLIF